MGTEQKSENRQTTRKIRKAANWLWKGDEIGKSDREQKEGIFFFSFSQVFIYFAMDF